MTLVQDQKVHAYRKASVGVSSGVISWTLPIETDKILPQCTFSGQPFSSFDKFHLHSRLAPSAAPKGVIKAMAFGPIRFSAGSIHGSWKSEIRVANSQHTPGFPQETNPSGCPNTAWCPSDHWQWRGADTGPSLSTLDRSATSPAETATASDKTNSTYR